MTLPPKLVTVLCLVQYFFIMAGYLIIRAFAKFFADKSLGDGKFAGLTGVIQRHGLWFLLVPLAWCVIASLKGEECDGEAEISSSQIATGVVITLVVIGVFVCGAGNAIFSTMDPGIQRM